MFHNCKKLESIDRLDFDTLSVTNMRGMLSNCNSLTSINVEFNPQNVEDMRDIFGGCTNLISIKAPNFGSTKIKNARGLFFNDISLKYVDLPNFEFPDATTVSYMFNYCSSIVFINLYSMKINGGTSIKSVFDSVNANVKICINDGTTRNILNKYSSKFDCSYKCFVENIKICLKDNKCVENCDECDYKYIYDRLCYEICPFNTYPIDN
jgi:surface protein